MTDIGLKLLVIKTQDLEKVTHFYRLIGITFTEERHGNGPRHFAAEIRQTIFEVYPAKDADAIDRSTRLGFSVSGLTEVMDLLQSHDVELIQEPSPIAMWTSSGRA